MKVIFAISDMNLGGSSQVVHDLVKNIDKTIFDVYLLVFFDAFPSRYQDLLDDPSINVQFLGKKKTLDFPFLKRLKEAVNLIRPDFVSCHLSSVFYLNRVVDYKKTKLFFTIHAEPRFDLLKLYRMAIHSNVIKKRIRLVGCCSYIAKQASALYGTDCVSIQNGIDLPEQMPGLEKKKYDFLCVGRFTKIKRFCDLITAFSRVRIEYPNARLAICGFGSEQASIIDFINEMRLNASVDVYDQSKDVRELYQSSKTFCLFSEREGFPITILEAMSYALPCIVTKVGGNEELVKNNINGTLVEVGDTDGQATAMKQVLEDEKLMQSYSRAALDFAKEHTSESMTKQYEALFLGKL